MTAAKISVQTRKRLWLRSGDRCAFPGCEETLLEPIPDTEHDTIVGIECHIVARNDSTTVARSVPLLSADERKQFSHLVDDRDGYENLVVMCPRHSRIIDDPAARHTVEQVVRMKREHERAIEADRSESDRRADAIVLRYAAIVDEWERRVDLDGWQLWIGDIFGDGHPRMDREDFDRLSETRRWMFSRVFPGTEPILEASFENFRYVAQDLQLVLEHYPHETLARRGVVAPNRFYNDDGWRQTVSDPHRLQPLYEWWTNLLEDLALELTRAANLFCEAVRQTIDPRYRLEQGLVILESGPYGDFLTRLHRPRYSASDGWSPYKGVRQFLVDRQSRDEWRGRGELPNELTLPGHSPFG